MTIRARYDRTADAAYISVGRRRKSETTRRVSHDVAVDFDRNGYVVGIEILNAREHFGPDINRLPSAVEELSLAEAAARCDPPRSPTTLRVQIRNGRLKATKRGRDWVVTAAELETYLEAVEAGRFNEAVARPMRRRRRRQESHD
jgi:uncharacterized protein YuzE